MSYGRRGVAQRRGVVRRGVAQRRGVARRGARAHVPGHQTMRNRAVNTRMGMNGAYRNRRGSIATARRRGAAAHVMGHTTSVNANYVSGQGVRYSCPPGKPAGHPLCRPLTNPSVSKYGGYTL